MDDSHLPDDLLAQADWVHRLARALLRDDDLAADVAQDVFTAALQRPPEFGPGGRSSAAAGRLRAWLGGVTRNLAARALKDRRERPRREAEAARRETEPDDAAERLRLHRMLTDAVLALPEPYRTVVTLRWFDGLSPRAIARRLDRTPEAIRQQVHRGLTLLRSRLDAEAGSRRAWAAPLGGLLEVGASTAWTLAWIPVMTAKKTIVTAVAAALLLSIGAFALLGEGEPPAGIGGNTNAGASAAADPGTGGTPAGIEDADAPAPARRAAPALVVQVLDRLGRPAADADVRCWSEDGPVHAAVTDTRGLARLPGADTRGGLAVTTPAHPPLVLQLEFVRGEHRVVLEPGLTVAGQLVEDGAPAVGLELELTTNPRELQASVPAEVAELLVRRKREATTDAQGRFVFTGLATDWNGSLKIPFSHWFAAHEALELRAGEREVRVPSPRDGLRLEVVRLPTVRGRVVWADTGEGVANAGVNAHATFANGEQSPVIGYRADGDGRFAVPVYPGSPRLRGTWSDPAQRSPVTEVWVNARAPGTESWASVEYDAEELREKGGEVRIEMQRAATRHFLALDEDGRPVAGARVQAADMSEPTGPDGRGTFQGGKPPFLVGAPGRQVARRQPIRPAAGTESDPLVFSLEPENRVLVRLRRPDGSIPAVHYVALRSTEPLFLEGRGYTASKLHRLMGCAEAEGWWSKAEVQVTLRPDAQGNITLVSLLPGKRCELRVCGLLQEVVTDEEIVTPVLGETVEVDLVVTAEERRLRGVVLSTDGRPLPNARVEVEITEAGDRKTNGTVTDAEGRFAFTALYARGTASLRAECVGYATQVREGIEPGNAQPVVFHLEPGRDVAVELVDEHGEPVATQSVWTELPGLGRVNPQDLGPGRFAFHDLPGGTVTFLCRIGGSIHRWAHDTGSPVAVIEVPRPGELIVVPPESWVAVEQSYDYADVTPIDVQGEGFSMSFSLPGERDRPELVPAGRYRVQGMRRHYARDDRPSWREPLGPAVEVTIRPGATERVQLE